MNLLGAMCRLFGGRCPKEVTKPIIESTRTVSVAELTRVAVKHDETRFAAAKPMRYGRQRYEYDLEVP
jgi:hypothetical protein